jgi:hypothetical protein
MMVGLSEATRLVSRHVGRAASSGGLSHLIAPQIFCALSRYGVIRFDRSFYLRWTKTTTSAWTSPPNGRIARILGCARLHPLSFVSVCCRKMLILFEPFICFCPSMDRRSALRSELCSWLFCPYSCLLKTAKLASFLPSFCLP